MILWKIHEAKVIRCNRLREELRPIAHRTLIPILERMYEWGQEHMKKPEMY